MSCTGSKKFRKICFCAEKLTENGSESFDCSSSAVSTLAESGDKSDSDRKPKKDRTGIFSIFSAKFFSGGFRKELKADTSMLKVERTIKAAILIQQWYRSYLARMEIRRRYTWTIFQSIEYQGEQNQVKVYDFFNALLLHMPDCSSKRDPEANSKTSSIGQMTPDKEKTDAVI